jgi:hypothetical protein
VEIINRRSACRVLEKWSIFRICEQFLVILTGNVNAIVIFKPERALKSDMSVSFARPSLAEATHRKDRGSKKGLYQRQLCDESV